MRALILSSIGVLWLAFGTLALAHPPPEIPVRSVFEESGDVVVRIEIDPRSFEEDPVMAPYVTKADFAFVDAARRSALEAKAADYAKQALAFTLDPGDKIEPVFSWEFTTLEGAPLKNDEDPVVLTGTWKTKLSDDAQGWQIEALNYRKLSVVFQNRVRGKDVARVQILFPGEKSYVLDIRSGKSLTPEAKIVTDETGGPFAGNDIDPMMADALNQRWLLAVAGLAILVFLIRLMQRRSAGRKA